MAKLLKWGVFMRSILFNVLILLVSVAFFTSVVMAADEFSIHYDSASGQYFVNDQAAFTIKPVSNEKYLDKVQYSVDNGPYQEYTGNIKLKEDGFHIVRFKAVDPVLNWSPTQNFRIYVDTRKPSSHADWMGNSYSNGQKYYVNEKARLVLSAQDDLSGVANIRWKKSEGDKVYKFTKGKKFKEGDYSLKISAIDNVGNVEQWKDFKFVVDGTSPTSTAKVTGNSYKKGEKLFFDKGSFISILGEDKISGVRRIEYKINDGAIQVYNQRISVSDNVTSIKYRSLDNVENYESWKSLTVYLDSTPPKLKLKNRGKYEKVAGKIFARTGLKIIANVYDSESGPKSLVMNNERLENTKSKEFVFTKEGEQGVYFSAEDNVGNFANSISYSIFIDESAPNTELKVSNQMVQKGDIFISSLPNSLSFGADDIGVGVDYIEYSYDGKKFNKVTTPIDLATWKKSKRTVYYRSIDKLGNIEKTKSMNIYVRSRGPKVALFVERGGDTPAIPLSQLKDYVVNQDKRLPASTKKKGK